MDPDKNGRSLVSWREKELFVDEAGPSEAKLYRALVRPFSGGKGQTSTLG